MKTSQVFVSHTADMARFPDGRPFVQAALDGVARAGMAPVDMRYFAARDGRPADYCRRRVRECDVYAAVIGFRYGSLVPGETALAGLSRVLGPSHPDTDQLRQGQWINRDLEAQLI
jgi:hypothetical protein